RKEHPVIDHLPERIRRKPGALRCHQRHPGPKDNKWVMLGDDTTLLTNHQLIAAPHACHKADTGFEGTCFSYISTERYGLILFIILQFHILQFRNDFRGKLLMKHSLQFWPDFILQKVFFVPYTESNLMQSRAERTFARLQGGMTVRTAICHMHTSTQTL